MRARILNRNSEIPSDGWFQIEVSGTHPAGKGRKQLIDSKAINSIHNHFQSEKAAAGEDFPGMLVDLDHLSHDLANSTEAWAWLKDTAIRNGELWGQLDLTDLGEAAIRNKRVKFFSTEYDPDGIEPAGDGLVRPLRLAGLAFTNRPNNRGGKPISNRSGDGTGEQTETNDKNEDTMKSIATTLGLPADADEDAINAKLTEVLSKLADLEAKQAGSEADAIMNRFGDRIPESARKSWRERLIKNRAETEALMNESFPEGAAGTKATATTAIFNRADAKAPTPVEAAEKKATEEANQKAAAIRNRASAIQTAEKIPFSQAFQRAQAELK